MNAITTETTTTTNYRGAFAMLLSDMFEPISDAANQASTGDNSRVNKPDGKTEAYVCIHLAPEEFVRMMVKALTHLTRKYTKSGDKYYQHSEPVPFKFIDIGCGVGQKVYAAERLFDSIEGYGMELRSTHVQVARETLAKYTGGSGRFGNANKFNPERIIEGNAITFDKYSDFDIIYFYCPSSHEPTEVLLENAIAKGAKVGCVVIGALSKYFDCERYKHEWQALGWECMERGIYKRTSLGYGSEYGA